MAQAVERVYLDHAATTSLLPAARDAWLEQSAAVGNASSLHASGRRVRRSVEEARESIAADLGVRPSAVIFTSGGTEADNLAVKGLYWRRRKVSTTVLASAVEHHAVLDPVAWLGEEQGADVCWLGVDTEARVDVDEIDDLLSRGPAAFVTVMWANNEVGTVQSIPEIAEVCARHGVPFHSDAVQALGHLPMNLSIEGLTAVTISSHKIGGPSGVGALILDPATRPVPVLHGGGQEREVRSGTLDAAGIAGFAVAVRHAVRGQQERALRIGAVRDHLIEGVLQAVPQAVLNGTRGDSRLRGTSRLPGNAHFSFPGCEGDLLLMLLDAAGIDCSTGSACTAGISEPSHVLLAMGADPSLSRSSLRFSLGENSTMADVDRLLAALPGVVDRAGRAGSLASRSG